MRRIKHFAGYGCVKAGVVVKTKNYLEIKVVGNHERGIEMDDKYDVFNWLVKRFDKTHTDYMDIEDVEIVMDWIKEGTLDVECAVYKIRFRDVDNCFWK